MLNLWEKLEPKERLTLLAIYGLSVLLAGIVGYGWGGGGNSPTETANAPMTNSPAPTDEMPANVETIDLSQPNPAPESESQVTANTTASQPETELAVHVSGSVQSAGVYQLPAGSRVVDAIQKAGGVKPNADLDALNLAEPLTDGQKIYVPRKGEVPPSTVVASTGRTASAPSGTLASSAPAPRFPININRASVDELETLPGIGRVLAERIVEYRQRNGGFQSVDELLEVRGIGPKKLEDIRPLATVR